MMRLSESMVLTSRWWTPSAAAAAVAFEAVRRGVKAYAQDIHAWPSKGLGVAISYCDPQTLKWAARQLLEALAPLRKVLCDQ